MPRCASPLRRRGNVLAMGFVFILLQALVVLAVQGGVVSLLLVEERSAVVSELPEPWLRVLGEALGRLESQAEPETPQTLEVVAGGIRLQFEVELVSGPGADPGGKVLGMRLRATSPLPEGVELPEGFSWPVDGGVKG